MEVLQSEMTQEIWDDWGALMRNQECAECGAGLTIHTIQERAAMALSCSADHNHSGFRQRTCLTEEYRRGAEVYPAVKDKIEAKMMVKTELQRAMNLLALRFPDAIKDVPGAALFINDCMRLGLDPLIQPAEAVPIPFRCKIKDRDGKVTGEKVTVAMIITEDGALSMAARGCQEEYDGPPATMTLMDYLMREHPQRTYEDLLPIVQRTAKELCDDAEAFVWVALGKRRSATEVNPVYGYYTRSEWEDAKRNRVPAAKAPGNQARVRAVKRWVRETYPEARQKMLEHTAELLRRTEGAKEAQEFIDAEYHFITDALISPPGQKAIGESAQRTPSKQAERTGGVKAVTVEASEETSPDEQIEGEGFHIDRTWLKESLNEIKWSDDTAKTFLASQYKVSPQGTLEDVIKRLTREQAEEFVKEIQDRVAQRQIQLFT